MRFQGKIRLAASFVSVVSLLTACSDDDDNGAIIVVDAGDDGGGATTDDTTDDTTADVTDVVTDTDTTVGDTSSMFTDDTDTTDTTGVSDGGVSDAGDTDTLGPDAAWDAATPDETWIDSGTDDVSSDGTSDNPDASDGSMGSELVFPAEAEVQNAAVPDGFAAWQWAEGLEEPRGITVDQSGNVLVVEQDLGRVLALWDDNGDGVSGAGERAVIAAAPGLNHGIALSGGYLYASSATTVYRWAYTDERAELGDGTAIVTGMPGGGNHVTRTLVFDDNYLYVSVGSANNVDANSERAQMRRFPIAGLNAATAFYDGELFADGLRNEVGLAVDPQGKVWGVENGMDNLFDSELGGDIHNDNPGEELNLFTTPGAFYGYPYCWSEFLLDADAGMGPGTQWALESDLWDPVSDEWCQDPNNVVPPELVFPAHVAPLGIRFYDGGNFPSEYVGDALVTFHGSWNAQPAVGYKVVRVPFGADGMPSGGWEPLYEFAGPGDTGNSWNERPVDLVVLPNGVVLVTSDDDADRIVAIGFAGL